MEPRNGRILRQTERLIDNGLVHDLRLGTINATTLNGKEEEVVFLMKERRLDILSVCETRMLGEGWKVLHDDYQHIYKAA